MTVPASRGGTHLWYDDRDIPALAQNAEDDANIQQTNATSIRSLLDAGFDADFVIDAVIAGDLSRLKGKHSGLFSVQLQPRGTKQDSQNGKVDQPVEVPAK